MTIQEYIKQQKELRQSIIVPSSLEHIFKMIDQFKPAIDIQAISAINPAINFLRPAVENVTNSITNWSRFSGAFENLDSANNFLRNITSPYNPESYSFREYDFSELIIESEVDSVESETILINESSRIKKIITDIYYDNSVLKAIEPREFEEVIAEILHSQGFQVELTKQTRDNGFDILALKYVDGLLPLKFLVECKRYTRQNVGVEIIRSFKEVLATENANRGIIATTSYFSRDAKIKRESTPYLLDYKDKDDVIEWIQDYYKKMCVAK